MDYMAPPPAYPAMQQPDAGRKPSDSGLSGLGLIMQLVGGLMTAIVASYGFMALIGLMQAGGRGGLPGTVVLFLLAVLGTSIARSVCHSAAGKRLCYDGAGTPASAMKRYYTIAFVQTGIVAFGLLANDAPGGIVMALILVLIAWPLALIFVATPRIREFGDAVPMADDKGFAGASILMLIFGAIGVCIGVILILGWLEMGPFQTKPIGLAMIAASAMMTVRSVFHVRAGLKGSSATLMADTAAAAEKYANFGTIAAVVAGGALLVAAFSEAGGRGGGGMMLLVMFMVVMVTWVLLVWPLAIKKFFGDRQFATLMEGQGAQASSDRGLPALGWLLLALGAYALAGVLATLIMGDMGDARSMRRSGNPMSEIMGMLGTSGNKWLSFLTAAVQLWAGVELITMSPRYKIAGMVFGVVAGGIALYTYLPMIDALSRGGAGIAMNPLAGIGFATVATALVVPIATLVFVQRKITDHKAVAKAFE
jgi:hypothetical protein